MSMKKPNIGIVTFPLGEANIPPLLNFVNISYSISSELYVITGNSGAMLLQDPNKLHIYLLYHKTGANTFTRIINYAYMQLKILCKLARVSRNVDVWLFPIGAEALLPAMLIAKLLRKPAILALTSSTAKMVEAQDDVVAKVVIHLVKVNCALSNRIVLYSERLIKEWNLEKYKDKICIAHEHFLDFDKFKIKKKFGERDNLVGYIGRLSEEKGTLNFVKAIPEISKEKDDLEFLIGGDGQLCDKIKKHLDENNLNDKVNLAGWIPHDKLPDYLNELKLVVLPSYTEGLPNLMLEAMACGTPVLSTPVGAIPDVITDSETGFIMEDNSPACIAENVIRAIEHPDLERIVENARALVEREFTYEAAVERYRKILENI